jgi:hypothetical protein
MTIYEIIISIFFCILVALFLKWISNIDRKIKKEEKLKKYYSEILKKEKEEKEIEKPQLNKD